MTKRTVSKRIFKTSTILVVMAILFLGVAPLGGCANRNSINFTVKYNAFSIDYVNNPGAEKIEKIITSRDAFVNLIHQNFIRMDNKDYYDDVFFTHYALIVLYFWGGRRGRYLDWFTEFIDIRAVNNVLEIHRTRYITSENNLFIGIRTHNVLIQVNQIDVVNTANIETVFRNRRRIGCITI